MKKIGLLFGLLLIFGAFSGCTNSRAIVGDKGLNDIKLSQEIFWTQIGHFKNQISDLQKENDQIRSNMSNRGTRPDSLSKFYAEQDRDRIVANKKLIASYQAKVDTLENKANYFISLATGKDGQTRFDFKGNPQEIAEAYFLIKQVKEDRLNAEQRVSAEKNNPLGNFKAIIENNWRHPVMATITGPTNYYREFKINPREKSPVFFLPVIGEYTTTFISRNEEKSVRKMVGPNFIYYDGNTPYDYKATLPEE